MSAAASAQLRPTPVRWPWLAVAFFFVMATFAFVLVIENDGPVIEQIPFTIAFAMFGIVGALILSRARNRIGALLLWGSATTAASFVAGELTTYWVHRGTTSGVAVVAVALIANLGWLAGILPVLLLLPLLFPDGRLLSRRWRPLAWLVILLLLVVGLSFLLGEPSLTGSDTTAEIDNPFAVSAFADLQIPDLMFNLLLVVVLVGTVASFILRFRRSRGVERQQLKWVAASLVFLVASLLISMLAEAVGAGRWVDTFVSGTAFVSLPVAIGIGVLQYRLYDLDVVVKKALVAGALVASGMLVYGVAVWAVGAIASDRAGSATLFGVALLLGVAFRPAMGQARKVADRLVYGRRATPYEVLTEFSGRVGEAYATDDVLGRMARILGEGVGAAGARVWLHVGEHLQPAGTWPEGPSGTPVALVGDALPEITGEVAVEVRDRGELLGALSVSMPPNDPMTPARERLVRDLASQAGLALRNVRLIEELKASQRRIVAAQDQERRKLERNIHDGAQQQLVALTVKLRLAQSLATKDGHKTAGMLEQLQAETQAALEDLRDLARGIYPPLLSDKGLAAALESQARKSPIPVDVSADGVVRYEPEVEAAVYFSCLEALQNVSKYAEATRASITLAQVDGRLTFEVEDDGRGFDPSTTGYGTGLQGMADRLAAVGGALIVDTAPGRGTRVGGSIKVAAAPRVEADEVAEPRTGLQTVARA